MYDRKTVDAIGKKLIRNHQTLAIAESVTAGHLQAAISTAENARQFFHGGIVAYNIGQKVKLLNIDPIHAEGCNCVSTTVARQMAIGVSILFNSTYGVGVTGYAAPVPEFEIEDLFSFYAIARHGKIIKTGRLKSAPADPLKVQEGYVNKILDALKGTVSK